MAGAGGRDDETLAAAWERNAPDWIEWARRPGHDVYGTYHRDGFLRLVPPPGRLTLDVGGGEGRLARDLAELGHRVVLVDRSPTMARAAAEHPAATVTVRADAARLPFPDDGADLVVAFMSLQDVDDPAGALGEIGRVLRGDGVAVVAVVHPLNGAGTFAGEQPDADAPFVIAGSYLASSRYVDDVEKAGLRMQFVGEHHSLDTWSRWIEDAGLVIDALREVGSGDPTDRWSRIPLFLHLRLRPRPR